MKKVKKEKEGDKSENLDFRRTFNKPRPSNNKQELASTISIVKF